MKYRWLRNFLKGCSLTAALFVFQACYGTPPGLNREIIEEEVSSEIQQSATQENAAQENAEAPADEAAVGAEGTTENVQQ